MVKFFYLKFLAQESNGTQGVLGPTKIYLAVQPPDPHPSVPKTSSLTTAPTQTKPIESTLLPQNPVLNSVSEPSSQISKTSEQVTVD